MLNAFETIAERVSKTRLPSLLHYSAVLSKHLQTYRVFLRFGTFHSSFSIILSILPKGLFRVFCYFTILPSLLADADHTID